MDNPLIWGELRRLSLNVSAAHIAMVAFLEEAVVPWTDAQVVEFERISAEEVVALTEYRSFLDRVSRHGLPTEPRGKA
ncbi:hypothetical protein NG726_14420 [Pseudomonas sp. MOB-449]|nr:hypothetical protein [Pseudomonas sp. MOB-449]